MKKLQKCCSTNFPPLHGKTTQKNTKYEQFSIFTAARKFIYLPNAGHILKKVAFFNVANISIKIGNIKYIITNRFTLEMVFRV